MIATKLVQLARAEVGVREQPKNSNCGPRVNEYKAATWLDPRLAWPWCAAFICWLVREAMKLEGVKETATFKRPRTAGAWDFINWSMAQDNSTSTVRSPKLAQIKAGDVLVFTFSHIGLCVKDPVSGSAIQTIEGNTDASGSREGGGVYEQVRRIDQIKARIRFTV